MKVLLDNGHGENTPGKRSPKWSDGSQLFEWEYAREIAKGVYNQLQDFFFLYISWICSLTYSPKLIPS